MLVVVQFRKKCFCQRDDYFKCIHIYIIGIIYLHVKKQIFQRPCIITPEIGKCYLEVCHKHQFPKVTNTHSEWFLKIK